MKRVLVGVSIVVVCALFCAGNVDAARSAVAKRRAKPSRRASVHWKVPPIANLAGIVVGMDTIDTVERRWGKGQVQTGGHSGGARVWRIGNTGWLLRIDGFEYSDDGEVVEDLGFETSQPYWLEKGLPPKKSVSVTKKGYWQSLPFGTSYEAALKWLNARKLKPKCVGDTITVAQAGRVRTNDWTVYRKWTAELQFEKKRLTGIGVDCE